jgi:hypothetical protein
MKAEPGWHNECECALEIVERQLFEKRKLGKQKTEIENLCPSVFIHGKSQGLAHESQPQYFLTKAF